MRWLTFLLLTGILLQTCSKELIFTEYLLNLEFIASVLCINKNTPQKHCNGKCHLKKQLARDEERQGDRQLSKTGTEIVYLVTPELTFEQKAIVITPVYFQYTEMISGSHRNPVFHPPGCFV